MTETIRDFSAAMPDGARKPLSAYADHVLLIVNTASKCGFTPQYAGLEELQREYAPRGFSVLAFPCNQFGGQEPGTDAEIGTFCTTKYGVTFPVFAKIEVNGSGADPIFKYLKHEKPGLLGSEAIKWNFTKFLVGRGGRVAARFAPQVKPEAIRLEIEKLLG